MVLISSVFKVSTAWLFYQSQNLESPGLTNKKRGMLTFQGSDLFLVTPEVCLRGLGCIKDSEKSFKILALFWLSIFIPTIMDKIFDTNSSFLVI